RIGPPATPPGRGRQVHQTSAQPFGRTVTPVAVLLPGAIREEAPVRSGSGRSRERQPMTGEVVFLYAFDVGNEIVPAKVDRVLGRKAEPLDVRRDHTSPR